MTPSEKFARKYLEPHHETIKSIFRAAWEHWLTIPDQERGIIASRKRTFANVIWGFVIYQAGVQFANSNVTVKERKGTVTFSVANQVLMRFKKICPKGLSSNYATQHALDFNLQIVMEGMGEALRVDVGYVMDPLGVKISEVRIVQRDGNRVAWQYPIFGEAAEASMGTPQLQPNDPTATSRVRVVAPPKRTAKEDGTAA